MINWISTTVNHAPRRALGLSCDEFALLDLIFKTQTHPTYSSEGWCEHSYSTLAEVLGIQKSGVFQMVDRLSKKELLEVNPVNSKQKKATAKFYLIAYESVQKVNDARSESERSRSESERHIKVNKVKYTYVDEQNSEFGSDCHTGASCAPHRNDQQIETQPHPLPPPRDKKKKGKYETQACRDDYEKYKSNVKVNYQNLYNSNVKILTHEQYSCLKSARGQMPKDIEDKYLDLLKVAHMSLNDNPASRQKFTSVIALYDSGLSNQGLLTLSKIIDHESTEGSLPESYKISRSPFSVACD